MLKKPITYTNVDGEEVTDVFYFHISEPELVKLRVKDGRGLGKIIDEIVETHDYEDLMVKFEEIIMLAYGEKTEDGKGFNKSPEIAARFKNSLAYPALFMEFLTKEDAAVEFLKGVVPKNIAVDVDDKALKGKVSAQLTQVPQPPTPPSS